MRAEDLWERELAHWTSHIDYGYASMVESLRAIQGTYEACTIKRDIDERSGRMLSRWLESAIQLTLSRDASNARSHLVAGLKDLPDSEWKPWLSSRIRIVLRTCDDVMIAESELKKMRSKNDHGTRQEGS